MAHEVDTSDDATEPTPGPTQLARGRALSPWNAGDDEDTSDDATERMDDHYEVEVTESLGVDPRAHTRALQALLDDDEDAKETLRTNIRKPGPRSGRPKGTPKSPRRQHSRKSRRWTPTPPPSRWKRLSRWLRAFWQEVVRAIRSAKRR